MNKVVLSGRLTRDPDVRYSGNESSVCIARYTLAVQRRFKREGESEADFISCVSFGNIAEYAERYFRQGIKVNIAGRIQTGSYTNRDGTKVYTTDVVVEEQEFAESKSASGTLDGQQTSQETGGGNLAGSNKAKASTTNQTKSGNSRNTTENKKSKAKSSNTTSGYNGYHPAQNNFMGIPDQLDDDLPFR